MNYVRATSCDFTVMTAKKKILKLFLFKPETLTFKTHLRMARLTTSTKNFPTMVPHVFGYALLRASVCPHSKGDIVVLYSTSEIHTSK